MLAFSFSRPSPRRRSNIFGHNLRHDRESWAKFTERNDQLDVMRLSRSNHGIQALETIRAGVNFW